MCPTVRTVSNGGAAHLPEIERRDHRRPMAGKDASIPIDQSAVEPVRMAEVNTRVFSMNHALPVSLLRATPQPRRTVDRFVCIYADTGDGLQANFRTRYAVFCEETGFEPPDDYPDGLERDDYDGHARHFLVWDRMKRRWAGAMRLIDAGSTRLPSEDIVGVPLAGLADRRRRAVEFSRLCILQDYRQTAEATFDGWIPASSRSDGCAVPVRWRQEDNEVLLRLLRASLAWRPEIEDCYFIVTPALSRVLKRFGIPLTPVGPKVEHRGTRLPFRYEAAAADAGMYDTLSAYAAISDASPPYQTYSRFFDDGADGESAALGVARWSAGRRALGFAA